MRAVGVETDRVGYQHGGGGSYINSEETGQNSDSYYTCNHIFLVLSIFY